MWFHQLHCQADSCSPQSCGELQALYVYKVGIRKWPAEKLEISGSPRFISVKTKSRGSQDDFYESITETQETGSFSRWFYSSVKLISLISFFKNPFRDYTQLKLFRNLSQIIHCNLHLKPTKWTQEHTLSTVLLLWWTVQAHNRVMGN